MKIDTAAPAMPGNGFVAERTGANPGADRKEALQNQAEAAAQRAKRTVLAEKKQPDMDMRALVQNTQTFLEFSIHEDTGTIMVKVKNRDTQEVIREIPPEKILNLVAALWDAAGLMVDERV